MVERKALIAGNWKMHTTVVDGCRLAAEVAKKCYQYEDREVLLAPPFTILSEVSHVLQKSSIIVASQNVCWENQGAFTGEISPLMVKDAGGTAAIVGHSERRQLFGEGDAMINKRLRGGLASGLLMILCIGETLDERENGSTFAVLEAQVRKGLEGVAADDMMNVVVAYEPVWAIGTGKTATKEQAQEAHVAVRDVLQKIYEKNVAERTRILYGGSVKPTNVDELMAQPDIDGALVGGAALDAESFGRIINFA
ncbi:triose-phosphate isomerase [Desulforhopalus singaporensis]|uniref:Triosephosphate isomerase n=1 Tax=Desulforhopalus singaporensis TaxID=91360 RepID=A0A1H0SDA7_9BACT|nr:triose-phosphate isomerase [Desulforhopalus singaporensis]SDP39753.1 triosephosphate isomerase [Desulforhopalus singaporensis]